MNSNNSFETFFETLKNMRGIADLNLYLMRFLIQQQPEIDGNTQKFLCLCFSLWDDGNTRVPLDAAKFESIWNRKWNSLKKLQESLDTTSEFHDGNQLDFKQIIFAGIESLKEKNFSKILTVKTECKLNEEEYAGKSIPSTPLIMTKVDGECPYLYLERFFRAKLLIEKYAGLLFVDVCDKLPDNAEIKKCQQSIAKIASYKKNGKFFPLQLNEEQAEAVLRGRNENLVITGGPGTGKTTVVLYILWSLLTQEDLKTPNDEMCDYSVYLAAPSGKAADRMQESLQKGLKGIKEEYKENSKVYKKLKDLEGSTIHRLLKFSPSKGGFTYNAKEQFSEKSIFVIDEASMIDVNLFASLLQAIPEKAKLFILGDPFQLPSVDAGAVLGEILKPKSNKNFCVRLTKTNRYSDDSVIGNLAVEIKKCVEDGAKAQEHVFVLHPALAKIAKQETNLVDKVFYYSAPTEKQTKKQEIENIETILKSWVGDFANLPRMAMELDPSNLDITKGNAIWELSLTKRILSAERRGVFGVEQINKVVCKVVREHYKRIVQKKLEQQGDFVDTSYFPGQLLMVTKNQSMYKLYNGDTGIVVYDGTTPCIMLQKSEAQKNAEKETDNPYVFYPLSLLPADAVESAFAITIHKSQGSEYDHVTMFLPKQEGHPLLNNQILYTGITRAKKTVTLIATPETFKAACETVIERDTGIEI
ncbi:AAA family ATPase [uncultured Fibrobacter sp.]|uniref:ATP-dependent DNA helicase n=1 Tax=uncultured Fibrobacter sp. TaxID=261512 RepID=UPI00261DE9EA|nr:AAA family ATPase [uncultured Fibrobacter sp.]